MADADAISPDETALFKRASATCQANLATGACGLVLVPLSLCSDTVRLWALSIIASVFGGRLRLFARNDADTNANASDNDCALRH